MRGEQTAWGAGRGGERGRLCVRGAGRSKASPRARPKPKHKNKPRKGFDRPNLMRRGRRGPLNPEVSGPHPALHLLSAVWQELLTTRTNPEP